MSQQKKKRHNREILFVPSACLSLNLFVCLSIGPTICQSIFLFVRNPLFWVVVAVAVAVVLTVVLVAAVHYELKLYENKAFISNTETSSP